jgi:hypothetical protein
MGPIPCSSSCLARIAKRRDSRRHSALLVSPQMWTTHTCRSRAYLYHLLHLCRLSTVWRSPPHPHYRKSLFACNANANYPADGLGRTVEHAATLEDIRATVLAPDRLNSLVFGLFAAVALLIAVVGVAGVLAFSVIARTREFGIRLALGSKPESILRPVLAEGAAMAGAGVLAGAAFGLLVALVAGSYFGDLKMPGALPVIVSAFVLLGAAKRRPLGF